MDFYSDIRTLLNNLENALTCSLCGSKCKNPVRIKICGHYFCQDCLKTYKSHNCPKCKLFFEIIDLDYNNIARETNHLLVELRNEVTKKCALDQQKSCKPDKQVLISDNQELSTKHTIIYKGTKYHINFANCLSSKLNAKGETQLHLACKRGKLEDVRHLIGQKMDLNIKDYAGWAPLHEAVQSQALDIVQILLQSGCLVNIPGADYTTPLHQAVISANKDIVNLLLSYGADTNAVDYHGNCPIDYAPNEVIKGLLTHQKDKTNAHIYELFLPNKIVLYCHSIDEEYKKKLKLCKNISVEEKIDLKRKLTHFVIKRTHKLSFKILQAMLGGLQFLTEDSVDNFIKQDFFINIPEYTFILNNKNLSEGIKKSMMSFLLKFPKLFDGINFFIEDFKVTVDVYNLKVDKESLSKLITTGGGRVLHRPPALRTCNDENQHPFFAKCESRTYRCCNYIIYQEGHEPDLKYNMAELQHKSSKWLIDCIINFEISD